MIITKVGYRETENHSKGMKKSDLLTFLPLEKVMVVPEIIKCYLAMLAFFFTIHFK